ncbi:MAG: type II toxin-antitoxin system PemK/MazF family toxin [Chloroflexota bacterium]|nr:MAG: type II toxin-antitoxin system PemK/MazF family toxin [Chloroflexota bacterium]
MTPPPRRGDVFDARLDPIEGSEQAGTRPVIVVSRDSLNDVVSRVIVIPCATYRAKRAVYPSQVLIEAPDGGLSVDSIALGDQVRTLSVPRLLRRRGSLSPTAIGRIDRALAIALDLPLT